MTEHRDSLSALDEALPLQERLVAAHKSLQDMFPFIVRIAIAIYDDKTDTLSTYIHSSGGDNPLDHYQAAMSEAPSLKAILDQKLPRVINHAVTFDDGSAEHTRRIGRAGYAASYTLPIFNEGVFIGFIFFNSNQRDVFTERVLRQMDPYAHLISLMIINELSSIQTLAAAVSTTGRITHVRDPETGSHLDRMSRYCRLIAHGLEHKYKLSDSYIEHLFMFAPLHDIGKIGIPDSILLKPDKLNDAEMGIMKSHAKVGEGIIKDLIDNFGLQNFEHTEMLLNITAYHHEAVDGSGYPHGIKGDDIPLEARIVAVADVFDALTSSRPYKDAWSNAHAVDTLMSMAGKRLDADCVMALLTQMDEVEKIQEQFGEDTFG
ncbi:MAG: HD domain-containing phosphohydrolase [Halieaceae bacterium]|jgi:HD-GYP domain-containing protein (c-di-GMP phosphodiesterase class II)|nr:HD domain-containing phosphohydrolase [Halieaceae bacterium]